MLYGIAVIGALILLVDCINFMNLDTARATMRGREISLRKGLGANRRQLIVQFLGESVLLTLLALLIALALVACVALHFLGKIGNCGHAVGWPPHGSAVDQLDAHRQVNCVDVLGKRADRDIVDAGFRDCTHAVERDRT